MATLQGHAIPLEGVLSKLADHTYVTCTGGHAWPCWGRDSGGKVICSGSGSSKQANCIAGPESHAGLNYAVTGVCHQTANRILWPSQVLVTKAKGYWISSILYGTYGIGAVEWAKLLFNCSKETGEISDCKTSLATEPHISAEERSYVGQVQALYVGASPADVMSEASIEYNKGGPLLNKDLALLVDYRIQAGRGSKQVNTLIELRDKFYESKSKMDDMIKTADISVPRYVKEVNEEVVNFQQDCQDSLGDELFTRLTGQKPGETVVLIDIEIAEQTLGRGAPA